MKAPKFSYVRAESIAQVISFLGDYGDDARILAGGQSLMPSLNMRLSQPRLIIDINGLEKLKGISLEGAYVRIGALARHSEVGASSIVCRHLPLIGEAMPHVAHVAVRNRGTFGGSIALADPAAEMPACVLALDATIVVEGPTGRREIAADDFFLHLYGTARRADELLIEVKVPIAKANQVFRFSELARRHGDFALAGVALNLEMDDRAVTGGRLVYFGSEDKPTSAEGAVAALVGKDLTPVTRDAAVAALDADLDPMTNIHGSRAMRLHLQKVLTRRALDSLIGKAAAA